MGPRCPLGMNRLSVAIGRAVVGAAALEGALRLEIARLLHAQETVGRVDQSSLPDELWKLDRETGGTLLGRLRKLGLPVDLYDRILSAVERRNQIVHRPFDDPELARAIAGTGNVEDVAKRIERLALDCGELAVELDMFAIPKVIEMSGMSLTEIVDALKTADPETFGGFRDRKQLEAVQAFLEVHDFVPILQELGIIESPPESDSSGQNADSPSPSEIEQ